MIDKRGDSEVLKPDSGVTNLYVVRLGAGKPHTTTIMSKKQKSVKGIYFKAGETSPRLIKVALETKSVMTSDSAGERKFKSPVLAPLLGPGGDIAYDFLYIDTMGYRGPQLAQPFRLFIRDNFMSDGSPRNMIPSMLTNGQAPHPWAGNLLALKETAQRSGIWTDCTMDDVATLIKYFEWYGDMEIHRQEMAQLQAMFPGVKVIDVSPSS